MFIVFSSTRSPDGVVLGGLPTGLLIVSPSCDVRTVGLPCNHTEPARYEGRLYRVLLLYNLYIYTSVSHT